jgi:hypothetical protein
MIAPLLDRAARAYMAAQWLSNGLGEIDDRTWALQRSQRVDLLVAALRVLRDSSAEMDSAGDDLSVDNFDGWTPAELVWHAMIDQLLISASGSQEGEG